MRNAFRRWWERKLPRLRWSADTTYIVPTLPGFCLLGGALAVFLLAAVYRNDTLYVYGFALLSLFFLGMLLTHANLRRVRVLAHLPGAPFAGTEFAIMVSLENVTNTGSAALWVRLVPGARVVSRRAKAAFTTDVSEVVASFEGASTSAALSYLEKKGTQRVRVSLYAKSRGRFPSLAAFVTSRSPLGLFLAWRVSNVSLREVVLPEPIGLLPLPWRSGHEGDDANETIDSLRQRRERQVQQELDGLAPFRHGDPLSRVVWRRFSPLGRADNRPLVRTLNVDARRHVVLSWMAASRRGSADVEATLSQLTDWLLACRTQAVLCDVDTPYWQGHDLTEAGCEEAMKAFALVAPQPGVAGGATKAAGAIGARP